jgi:hypothetical protein
MPDVIIAAIARVADHAQLEKLLAQCAGLESSRITVFRTQLAREVPPRLRMHFVPARGAPVASASHGTNVPGMAMTLALNPYAMDSARTDHLKDIGISSDAAHYYNVAIDEGRSVVTYVTSTENAALAQEQFRACGFVKIRTFPCAEDFSVECATELL